jgi:hypothetical protein
MQLQRADWRLRLLHCDATDMSATLNEADWMCMKADCPFSCCEQFRLGVPTIAPLRFVFCVLRAAFCYRESIDG